MSSLRVRLFILSIAVLCSAIIIVQGCQQQRSQRVYNDEAVLSSDSRRFYGDQQNVQGDRMELQRDRQRLQMDEMRGNYAGAMQEQQLMNQDRYFLQSDQQAAGFDTMQMNLDQGQLRRDQGYGNAYAWNGGNGGYRGNGW